MIAQADYRLDRFAVRGWREASIDPVNELKKFSGIAGCHESGDGRSDTRDVERRGSLECGAYVIDESDAGLRARGLQVSGGVATVPDPTSGEGARHGAVISVKGAELSSTRNP